MVNSNESWLLIQLIKHLYNLYKANYTVILTETYLKVPEVNFAFAYVQQSVNKICFPKTTTPVSASWILDIHFPELKLKLYACWRHSLRNVSVAHIVTVVVIVIDLVTVVVVVIVLVGCF